MLECPQASCNTIPLLRIARERERERESFEVFVFRAGVHVCYSLINLTVLIRIDLIGACHNNNIISQPYHNNIQASPCTFVSSLVLFTVVGKSRISLQGDTAGPC